MVLATGMVFLGELIVWMGIERICRVYLGKLCEIMLKLTNRCTQWILYSLFVFSTLVLQSHNLWDWLWCPHWMFFLEVNQDMTNVIINLWLVVSKVVNCSPSCMHMYVWNCGQFTRQHQNIKHYGADEIIKQNDYSVIPKMWSNSRAALYQNENFKVYI